METIDYSNFNLPPEFQTPTKYKRAGDGVDGVQSFDYGEGYVPWRFVNAARPWKADKVKRYRADGADTVPVLMFYRDRDNQIPVKLRRRMRFEDRRDKHGDVFEKQLPMTLEDLKLEGIESPTEADLWELPVGFDGELFQVAFEKWKAAGVQKGTPLSAWRADPGHVQTLSSLGIYTVEQFGRMDEQLVKQTIVKLPPSLHGALIELHEMAVIFVESQSGLDQSRELGDKLQAMTDSNERLEQELEEQRDKYEALLAKIKGDEGEKKTSKKTTKQAEDE